MKEITFTTDLQGLKTFLKYFPFQLVSEIAVISLLVIENNEIIAPNEIIGYIYNMDEIKLFEEKQGLVFDVTFLSTQKTIKL